MGSRNRGLDWPEICARGDRRPIQYFPPPSPSPTFHPSTRQQKGVLSGSPARPRGLPGGAEPARLRRLGESRIAAHSRARLALEELSQSLSLKVRTGYHGQLF